MHGTWRSARASSGASTRSRPPRPPSATTTSGSTGAAIRTASPGDAIPIEARVVAAADAYSAIAADRVYARGRGP